MAEKISTEDFLKLLEKVRQVGDTEGKVKEKEAEIQSEENDLSDDSIESGMANLEEIRKATTEFKEIYAEFLAKLANPIERKLIVEEPETEEKEWPGGWGEYLTAIVNATRGGRKDERLIFVKDVEGKADARKFESKAPTAGHLEEATGSYGGYLVPTEQRMDVLQLAIEQEVVRPRAMVLPMASDTLEIPTVDDTSHASNIYGGVLGYWKREAASLSEVNPSFGQVTLKANKLTVFTYSSNELLNDNAVGLETLLKSMLAKGIAYYEDVAFIAGDGGGEPQGFRNASARVQVTRTNAAGDPVFEDYAEMFGRLLPTSYGRAIWIISPAVVPSIIKLESPAARAATAGGHLAYLPINEGLAASPLPFTMLGRPMFVSEKVPTAGSTGDVSLVDLSYYILGDRQSLVLEASMHNRFQQDEMTWRGKIRVDGQPWVSSAFTPRNSGDTLSPFVELN